METTTGQHRYLIWSELPGFWIRLDFAGPNRLNLGGRLTN